MNKYIIFSVIGLAVILSAGTALAYQGDNTKPVSNGENYLEHGQFIDANRQKMDEIFTNKDFAAWKTDMETRTDEMQARVDEMRANITEDNFAKMSQMHELMQAGDYEGAQAIRDDLGIGGLGRGMGEHKMGGFGGRHFSSPVTE